MSSIGLNRWRYFVLAHAFVVVAFVGCASTDGSPPSSAVSAAGRLGSGIAGALAGGAGSAGSSVLPAGGT
jgi:hypothetical protein